MKRDKTDMRKVITGAFVSLDGVMQAPGGPKEDPTQGFELGGWVVPYVDEVFGQAINEMFAPPFDLLLGRRTYEIFAAHWPYAEGGDYDLVATRFNSVTQYVATRSSVELAWKGSVALHDAAVEVARLKGEDGPPLVTQGSSDLIQTLLVNDLIDEINTFTFPIVLGNGKKLFGNGATPAAFKLLHNQVTTTGVIITRYQRAGAVATGDYAMDPPTPAEVARRERIKLES
jgi:dihydrofolate reductase